ncbi:ribonucleoside reductase class II, partial [Candidatus Woesearchaeota archaeon]|nr:ribonucleoside reductase class II [Candidatus Woesearchaeota archaeon]
GANMGILNSNHPDIEKFITAKDGNKALRNFNISVLIMGDFWKYYEADEPYPLVNPKDGKVVKHVSPRALFDKIVYQAWESAEPGVIFFDKVNDYNPFYEHLGPIVTTNPCVAGDTLISTENGLERIDSIKTKNIIVDVRTESTGKNLLMIQKGCKNVEAEQIIKTGVKDAYKLTTKSGYEIVATADHRVLTDNGWKEVGQLTGEDSVFLQSGQGNFNKNTEMQFKVENRVVGENGRTYTLNLPTKWSRELGLLLGWLTGDGWLSEKYNSMGLVFAPEDKEIKEVLKPIFERYCNREVKEVMYENKCIQLRSASKYVVKYFKNLGVTEQRCVPNALFTATEEAVIGFLQGLFAADGTIGLSKESRNYIRLNSSSTKLLKDVQLLLLNLGIRSSIYNRSTKPKEFKYTNAKGELVIYKTSGTNYELNVSKENVPRFADKIGFIHSKLKEKALKLNKFKFYEEYFVDSVKSVEYVGKKEVYDITEPSTHSFIANGLVVHNCGEVLLYPNEPCNLGSINVWAFAKKDEETGETTVDWDGLKEVVMSCTRFLDNVIDVNNFPLKSIEEMSLSTRKVGLGVMGVANLLYELKLPYNTDEGRQFMEKLMEFIAYWSKVESIKLAQLRGNLPYYSKSFYKDGRHPIKGPEEGSLNGFNWDKISQDMKKYGIRNGYTTIIAPTGSISMIAGCSSGMEPVYSVVFEKNVKVGSFFYIDPAAEKVLREEGLFNEKVLEDINKHRGSIQNIDYIPEKIRKALVTAMDITPEDHIRALAAFQRWVDSSISKTNNFPADATLEHMRDSYIMAYRLGCKDVTVFRDSSIKDQVLVAPSAKEHKQEAKAETPQPAKAVKEAGHGLVYANNGNQKTERPMTKATIKNCPECNTLVELKEGCLHCPGCGWGLCM